MYKIIHTATCTDVAGRITASLNGSQTILIESAIADPESLGDFDCLGLVFERQENGVPASVISFITDVLGEYDLSELQHMFSICVCEGSPAHALKIVEKLCSKVGCAPSLSIAIPPSADVASAVEKIRSGEIILAKGSLGTMFYMKAHGIKGRGQRR